MGSLLQIRGLKEAAEVSHTCGYLLQLQKRKFDATVLLLERIRRNLNHMSVASCLILVDNAPLSGDWK
jgi:hypothetical protein